MCKSLQIFGLADHVDHVSNFGGVILSSETSFAANYLKTQYLTCPTTDKKWDKSGTKVGHQIEHKGQSSGRMIYSEQFSFFEVYKEIMKLPGGFDLNSMMQQAQQMQEKMGKEMKETVVEASAGGGAVTVKMRGDFEVVELKISPDTVKDGDVEMIQDLTVAALNEAHRKVEESLKGKLGGMLPPGLM